MPRTLGESTERLIVTVPEELARSLRDAAHRERRPTAYVLRDAFERYLEDNGPSYEWLKGQMDGATQENIALRRRIGSLSNALECAYRQLQADLEASYDPDVDVLTRLIHEVLEPTVTPEGSDPDESPWPTRAEVEESDAES